MDYLTQEFLRGLPDDERTFLLRSSVLAPVSGADGRLRPEQTHSTERLRRLVRSGNVFVMTEHGDGLIRYHPLFAESWRQSSRPSCRTTRRAGIGGRWNGTSGPMNTKRRWATRWPPATPRATKVMFRRFGKLVADGKLTTLERWLDAIAQIGGQPDNPLLWLGPSLGRAPCGTPAPRTSSGGWRSPHRRGSTRRSCPMGSSSLEVRRRRARDGRGDWWG